jgi:hypothetical protein
MDHDRLAEVGGELELLPEEAPLEVAGSVVTVEVEPDLPERDGAFVAEKVPQLTEPPGVGPGGLVRVDPEDGEDADLSCRDRQRLAAGFESRADRDYPLDPRRARTSEQFPRRVVARVEVRVGVR